MQSGKSSVILKWSVHILFAGLICVLIIGSSTRFFENTDPLNHSLEKIIISSVEIPENLDFAGEKVPLINFDTRESFERELLVNTYWQSQTLLLIKKSKRYFSIIEPILEKNGIPKDFKYLPLIESGFSNVVSPSGAAGFWQFKEETAKELGLIVNKEVDERYNLSKSTEAACKFLIKSYLIYQSWTLAAASYNNGRHAINIQVDKQKIKNYYDLLLNDETARYIFRILAIKTILNNPEKYGFYLKDSDYYGSFKLDTVKVNSSVKSFADFAKLYNLNYKMLKFFNPWLRDNFLTNKEKRTYYINIPVNLNRKITLPNDSVLIDSTNVYYND
jgi:membrane-bound lytic murein transglycosylase D